MIFALNYRLLFVA